jgi:transposase-like protein
VNQLADPAFSCLIIPKEIMSYKEQIKQNELTTKIRIIRLVKKDRLTIMKVAENFDCHRNTVRNILKNFSVNISSEDQKLLLSEQHSFGYPELVQRYQPLVSSSRKPKSHKRSATKEEEEQILKLFHEENIKVGFKRMKTHLKRRFRTLNQLGISGITLEEKLKENLRDLSLGKLKGIYRRHKLKVKKVRSSNGERRALYDYQALGAFERLHYDVKHILDKHALPENIYQMLSQKEIPKYEWNIIDAKTRLRFIAYSYELTSEFGLQFLLFVIQYIRRSLLNPEQEIVVGFDNGGEFCSGSTRKEDGWNELLGVMNARVYSYEPRFDVRKNLIERSHLSDDEELYISRGWNMGTKEGFIEEVSNYALYWNYERPHSGIGMYDRTPYEVLKQSGMVGIQRLLLFPTLILEDVINDLRVCTRVIEVEHFAKQYPLLIEKSRICQKTRRNIEESFFLTTDAQNVLTYYRNDS